MTDLAERKETIGLLKQSIKEIILKTIPDIESIHMGGSSSRNEETHFMHDGKLVLLGNVAYVIFTRQNIRAFLALRRLQLSLAQLSKHVSPDAFPLQGPVILTKPIEISLIPTKSVGLVAPDIAIHEIVKNDSLLYGKDMRSLLPDSIPAASAVKIVLNRLVGLSLCANLLLQGVERNPLAGRIINYESAKGILAALEAVLVTEGRYLPSYRERIAFWPTLIESKPDLATALPELGRNLPIASKIRATPESSDIDPGKLWLSSRNLLLATLSYLWYGKKLSIYSLNMDSPGFRNYFYLFSNGRLNLRNIVASSKKRSEYYLAMIEGVKAFNDDLQIERGKLENFSKHCHQVGVSADRGSDEERYLRLCSSVNLGCTKFELSWIDQKSQVVGREMLLSSPGGAVTS